VKVRGKGALGRNLFGGKGDRALVPGGGKKKKGSFSNKMGKERQRCHGREKKYLMSGETVLLKKDN